MPTNHPNRILVLFAHPALQKSRIHRRLMQAVSGLEGVTFHDLYETYPDFHIHVRREQQLLAEHNVIVFQHPLYWFSVPALLKEWQELVLEYKWAYGKAGVALQGKKLLTVTSTGGREALFAPGGYNRRTMQEFLAPIDQMAVLCGMEYYPPFVVHGTHAMKDEEIAAQAADYVRLLSAIRDGRIDWDAAKQVHRLNADLERIMRPA